MKKTIVFIFLLFSFFTSGSVAFANDGSLQIDTSLDKNPKKTEIQYFEMCIRDSDPLSMSRLMTRKPI